jgi:hypothetical protein
MVREANGRVSVDAEAIVGSEPVLHPGRWGPYPRVAVRCRARWSESGLCVPADLVTAQPTCHYPGIRTGGEEARKKKRKRAQVVEDDFPLPAAPATPSSILGTPRLSSTA